MNLWFRLLAYIIALPWKPSLEAPFGHSFLRFRVWPSDLDTNLHMNNGRYLTIMDFGRLDMTIRMGLWRAVWKNGWMPVLSSASIRFRRELRLFEPFEMESSIRAWRGSTFIMEHRFRFTSGNRAGAIAATALVKGGIYDRKTRAFIPIEQLMKEIGQDAPESPPFTPEIEAVFATEDAIRSADQSDARAAHDV